MNYPLEDDPLYSLYKLVKGDIIILVNDHLTSYLSVNDEIRQNFEYYQNIDIPTIQEMIGAGSMVCVKMAMNLGGRHIDVYGDTVLKAVNRALTMVAKELGLVELPRRKDNDKLNSTELLDKLGKDCASSVYLTINEHKGVIWDISTKREQPGISIKDWVKNRRIDTPEEFELDEDGDGDITPRLIEIMEETNEMFHIQFFPNTSVGFFSFHHSHLGEILERAVSMTNNFS